MTTIIKTPPFRLSFPVLFSPALDMNGRSRHSLEMLLPKSYDNTQFAPFFELYDSTIPATWKKPQRHDWRSPSGWQVRPLTFIDGDAKKQDERHGMWILRATSGPDYPPRVLLSERDPLDGSWLKGDERSVYAGCWCVALLTAYAFDHEKGTAGVAFNLNTIQKVNDDTPFGKRVSEQEADQLLDDNLPF